MNARRTKGKRNRTQNQGKPPKAQKRLTSALTALPHTNTPTRTRKANRGEKIKREGMAEREATRQKRKEPPTTRQKPPILSDKQSRH